jgi:predicted metal-dependent hydrolase
MRQLPEEFLRGIELFNKEKFFECHEVWETIWFKSYGVERYFLHAMIQVAAALHHVQRGNRKGAISVGRRAIGKLEAMPNIVMQLDTIEFRQSLERFLANPTVPFPLVTLQSEHL